MTTDNDFEYDYDSEEDDFSFDYDVEENVNKPALTLEEQVLARDEVVRKVREANDIPIDPEVYAAMCDLQKFQAKEEVVERDCSMSWQARDVYDAAYTGLSSRYCLDPPATKSTRVVGIANLATYTPEVVERLKHVTERPIVELGHVGAVSLTEKKLQNMSAWTGTCFEVISGDGRFQVHGVSAKIDGTPILPVTIYKDDRVDYFCWIFEKERYVLSPTTWELKGRAELRHGVVYTREPKSDTIMIGDRTYKVCASPIVLLSEIRTLASLCTASDGYILHSGLYEYKVKFATTMDLKVDMGVAYSSDMLEVLKVELPNGVYEFDLHTQEFIRGRPDRQNGNSAWLLQKLKETGTVAELYRVLGEKGWLKCPCVSAVLSGISPCNKCKASSPKRCVVCTVRHADAIPLELPTALYWMLDAYANKSVEYLKDMLLRSGYVIIDGLVKWVQDVTREHTAAVVRDRHLETAFDQLTLYTDMDEDYRDTSIDLEPFEPWKAADLEEYEPPEVVYVPPPFLRRPVGYGRRRSRMRKNRM